MSRNNKRNYRRRDLKTKKKSRIIRVKRDPYRFFLRQFKRTQTELAGRALNKMAEELWARMTTNQKARYVLLAKNAEEKIIIKKKIQKRPKKKVVRRKRAPLRMRSKNIPVPVSEVSDTDSIDYF